MALASYHNQECKILINFDIAKLSFHGEFETFMRARLYASVSKVMAKLKISTENIIKKSDEIRSLLRSKTYRDQVVGQDISSDNSPYRNGDQTYSEALTLLEKILTIITLHADTLDQIEPGMRSNFQNYLNNLESWFTSNPLGNWSNIMSYINTLYTWIHQYGLNSADNIDKEVIKKYNDLKITANEFEQIRSLSDRLSVIGTAADKLEQASEIVSFVNQAAPIEKIANYVETAQSKIDALTLEAEKLLTKGSDAVMAMHFSDVASAYKRDVYGSMKLSTRHKIMLLAAITFISLVSGFILNHQYLTLKISNYLQDTDWQSLVVIISLVMVSLVILKDALVKFTTKISSVVAFELNKINSSPVSDIKVGWVHYFIISVLVFLPATIWYISTLERLEYSNEFLEVFANGLVRAVYLSPALLLIAFISRNFLRKDKRRESYEFKAVTARTLQGHILMLKEHASESLTEVSTKIISQMYEEPKDSFAEKGDLNLDTVNELLSVGEKIKNISKG